VETIIYSEKKIKRLHMENWYAEKLLDSGPKSTLYIVKNKNNKPETEKLFVYKKTILTRKVNEIICPVVINHESVINIIDYQIQCNGFHDCNSFHHCNTCHECSLVVVYEYIPGIDVFYRFEKVEVDLQTIALYVREMAKCIKLCHDKNIVHLDIKPENFIIKSENPLQLVLIDFEFSEILKTKTGNLYTKTGTESYCAPETIEYRFSKKSDIYSLGAICYTLFTNKLVSNSWLDTIENYPKKKSVEFLDFLKKTLCRDKIYDDDYQSQAEDNSYDRMDIDEVLNHPWLICSYPS
jgi:serine/threonine protein kinase